MRGLWRSKNCVVEAFVVFSLCVLNSSFCWALNDEGVALLRFKEGIVIDPQGALSNWKDEVGVENPCSWFGVGCSDGYVVVLNLKDLCLRGTIAPEIGNLIHIKSIFLSNNSFSGAIPDEIAKLKKLEVLDLRYNNLSGQLPCHLGDDISVLILLLDNNDLLDSSGGHKCRPSEVEEDLSSRPGQASSYSSLVLSWKSMDTRPFTGRKMLESEKRTSDKFLRQTSPHAPVKPQHSTQAPTASPAPSPSPSPSQSQSSPSIPHVNDTPRSPAVTPKGSNSLTSSSQTSLKYILSAAIGGPLFIALLGIGIFCYRSGKVSTVKPWATGLSGQLQRAFVTGVPELKRSELEVACEEFSNVIGSLTVFTLYKGTLSSGVEIAVASIAEKSKNQWSSSLETQFRKKIDTLSKVNHKNFINLIGCCEEDEPFTRMLVFEYAPNGTLFEHLHIKEAEHLDWEMRLRIAVGIVNCLDHMHNLTPPIPHRSLTSSSVYLSEDYAAQVSDSIFCDKGAAAEAQPTPQANIYSFGILLLEMMTGKLPYSSGSDSLEDWASDYLKTARPLEETVDPTLRTYKEHQLQLIDGVISSCVAPDPQQRPSTREICLKLREITGLGLDGAIPKLSPLWWAELEIMSTEAI